MIRKVTEGLYRGPRLLQEEYPQLKALGISTVFSLESDQDAIYLEGTLCDLNKINVRFRPMSEIWPASLEELTSIVVAIERARSQGIKVYVHCRRGIDRTGQVVAAWRIRYGLTTFDDAYAEQISFGHPELYNLVGWRWVLSRVKRYK
jgi:protein-tyrosine phosphatase